MRYQLGLDDVQTTHLRVPCTEGCVGYGIRPSHHDNIKKKVPMPRTAMNSKPGKSLINLEPPARQRRPESMTSREQQIIELIWAGFINKEIGHRLNISVKTVEAHRANMMKKLRVSNTAQLLKGAIQSGILRIRGTN